MISRLFRWNRRTTTTQEAKADVETELGPDWGYKPPIYDVKEIILR